MEIEIYGKIPSKKGTIKLAIIHADSMFEGLQQFMADLVKDQRIKNSEKGWKSPYCGTEVTKILIKD